MNKVILIGRLCNEVETRRTQSGKAVASYRLAVDRQFKQDGQTEADFLNCVAFGSNGEFAGKYLSKGMKIAIEGRIQTRTYDDKDGKKVYVTEIIVEHHEFCEKKADSGNTYVGNYGGYGQNYSAPAYPAAPASDFAMLEDEDEGTLPF
jgi:single-strand DNA-binding protein